MAGYLVDTWYFIARYSHRDSHHQHALRLDSRLGSVELTTHDAVFIEFLAYFSGFGRVARLEAAAFVRESVRQLTVVPCDRPLFIAALDMYERRSDKEYSLVDCMSMVVMRDRGITHVLTNDHHFRQEGFTVVSE